MDTVQTDTLTIPPRGGVSSGLPFAGCCIVLFSPLGDCDDGDIRIDERRRWAGPDAVMPGSLTMLRQEASLVSKA